MLWDLDGTIVDTEPIWIDAEFRLAEIHGGRWTMADAHDLVGQDLRVSAAIIAERMGLDLAPDDIVGFLVGEVSRRVAEGVAWRPGARELLAELGSLGVPQALVTMSYASIAASIVDGLPDGTFAAVVTGDRVTRGKPDPEAYETAARLLGVDARTTVAIEDSPTGAASAQAAGCVTLVVPNHVEVPEVPGRHVLADPRGLAAVDAARLSALVAAGGDRAGGVA